MIGTWNPRAGDRTLAELLASRPELRTDLDLARVLDEAVRA